MSDPTVNLTFRHHWQAEVLTSRPLILPARHFVYPLEVEEVERGALEVLVRPGANGDETETRGSTGAQPFLATCALGFRDPAVPTGLWSTPKPEEICVVSGGYAYVIDTAAPERFTMIAYRPVLQVHAAVEAALLLFVGHRSVLAWSAQGQAWEAQKLSDEGVTITAIESGVLRGLGWSMMTDKESEFVVDLASGSRLS